ncbi:MAG: hypothetical protein L0Z07_05235, partial [Planctomycetes bacterium]|nr:hypothetical protein [Planctomycetota bacterium]
MYSGLSLLACAMPVLILLAEPPEDIARSGIADNLAYSNTLGTSATGYGGGITIADDISFTRVAGCQLDRMEFDVDGNTDSEGVGAFAVDFQLFDDCPGAGGVAIPGTQGHVDFGNNGKHTVKFAVPANVDVVLPRTVWLA